MLWSWTNGYDVYDYVLFLYFPFLSSAQQTWVACKKVLVLVWTVYTRCG